MDALVGGLTPLEGGFSGETFLAEAAGERTVVRIYADRGARRGPQAVEVDAAVLRLVRGLVPVPEVLEVRRANPDLGMPALLVTSYLEGTRLDLLLPQAGPDLRRVVGERIGELLARLAQMPMLRPGLFVDRNLSIGDMPAGGEDLPAWVKAHLEQTALADWTQEDQDALLALADQAQSLLDACDRTCLVHSDFNPKNILVDPDTGAVTGLLDWEFAHAGLPVTDLGNLLRFERDPVFIDAVVRAYTERVPDAGEDLLDLARAADLWALVDLAARRGENPVAGKAHDRLLAMARAADLHAVDGA